MTLRGPRNVTSLMPQLTQFSNFCLRRAANDHKERLRDEDVSAVDKDFYVDYYVKSVRTLTKAS